MRTTIIAVIALALATCAGADTYRIDWSSINAGGGEMSGGQYTVKCTIGQPAAGFVQGDNLLHWVGFWAGDVPTPTVVARIGDAKLLQDGRYVSVSGKIATSAAGDFGDFFYIEEAGRFSGIRIAAPPASVSGLTRGSVVNVIGMMATTPGGERQLAGPMVIIASTTAPLTPLAMANRSLGGGNVGVPPLGQYGITGSTGLNTVGLLIKTWGQVTATGPGYVDIDDGSGTPVRVDTSLLASCPAYGSFVSVIGVSSIAKPATDRLRLVLPRGDGDVQ